MLEGESSNKKKTDTCQHRIFQQAFKILHKTLPLHIKLTAFVGISHGEEKHLNVVSSD